MNLKIPKAQRKGRTCLHKSSLHMGNAYTAYYLNIVYNDNWSSDALKSYSWLKLESLRFICNVYRQGLYIEFPRFIWLIKAQV